VDNFKLITDAFRKHSFYILGAGVSAGIIPMTHQQGELIVNRHLEFGIFSVNPIEIDPQATRILGSSRFSDDQMKKALIDRLPSGAIRAISMQLMTPDKVNKLSHKYVVFNKARRPSIIFNYNNDGLASRYCKRHYILYPHSVLDEIFRSNEWDRMIDDCLFYHFEPPVPSGLILIGREPIGIINNPAFRFAEKHFKFTEDYVVIVGYSFGFNGLDVDDWVSLDFFKRNLRKYRRKVLVIDRDNSRFIADMLSYEFMQNDIFAIAADWDYLARAILFADYITTVYPNIKEKHKLNLHYIYNSIADKLA
jgi:hypothetical protein